MPAGDGRARERIHALEQDVRELERQLAELVRESGAQETGSRIAKTVGPFDSGSKVVPIIFLDGAFEEETSTDEAEYTDRQETSRHFVCNLNDAIAIAEDVRIEVFPHNGQWWTWYCE